MAKEVRADQFKILTMNLIILANGTITKDTDEEFRYGMTVLFMKDNGKTAKLVVKVD